MFVYYKALEISSLTDDETIRLASTLHAISDNRFLCSTCQVKNAGEEKFKKVQQIMACNYTTKEPRHHISGHFDMAFNTCIGNYFSQSALTWVEAHVLYESGVLPYHGGYMDQPHKAIEIMRIIQSHKIDKMQKDHMKKKFQRGPSGR